MRASPTRSSSSACSSRSSRFRKMLKQTAAPAIRVLYVDDDVALVRLIQKSLGRRGFDVVHAANAEEALAQIVIGGIQVVALDHYLANGTGLDFLARLASLP